jgi:hypothetical protein
MDMTQILESLIEIMILILLIIIFQDRQRKTLNEQRITYLERQMEEAAKIILHGENQTH